MTMLRQIRSTGPMRAPCFRGLSPGHFMLNVYWVLFLCVPDTLAAPCVTCFGFQPGCTFETDGKCPMADIPAANLAITAKAGVGGALMLQNAVSNKYNRVINREGLNSLQALMRRPSNGTPVAITKTTSMKTILGWIQSEVCSLDWALMEYMELVEAERDGDERKRLMANYNMLSTAKTTITAVSTNMYSSSGIGVTLLLLGFCFAYVRKDNKLSKVGGETSEADKEKSEGTSSAASVSAHVALKLLRPLNYYQFSQALQLFILYGVQLAIFPFAAMSEFLLYVVHDTINKRGRPWQFAQELMLVMLKRIDDAGDLKKLNLLNIVNEAHLNTVYEEAMESAKYFYPAIFRAYPGKGEDDVCPLAGAPDEAEIKYNGKWTRGAGPCSVFNTGGTHGKHVLTAEGKCKYDHVCDHWVSDKGPKGRCLSTEHERGECDNPSKCAQPVQ